MEQIQIRNLPTGTKAAAAEGEPVTIIDLLGTDEGADIEFESAPLGLTGRSAEL